MLMTMVVMAVMMKMMLLPPRILVDTGSALCEFPLWIPSGGEVLRVSGVSVCWISYPPARGWSIWRGWATDTRYRHRYRRDLHVWLLIKVPSVCLLNGLPPRCVNKYSVYFCSFRFAYYSSEITSLNRIFIAPHDFRDPGERSGKIQKS
jgi:hypothetical protein